MTATRRPRRSSGRITLNDVADAAGVSPITVSRALRGERSVDPVLAERVHEAADRLAGGLETRSGAGPRRGTRASGIVMREDAH